MIESWLRICNTRPWWKVSAQNEHSPKQPRLELMENLDLGKGRATPPARVVIGSANRGRRGGSATSSISSVVSVADGGFCTT